MGHTETLDGVWNTTKAQTTSIQRMPNLAKPSSLPLAQRRGREAATHLVYTYFAKSTDLCGESQQQQHSPRSKYKHNSKYLSMNYDVFYSHLLL